MFDAPSTFDEFPRKPIQQPWMTGRRAQRSEILNRRYQSFTEMMLPDSIHHHARGQRVIRLSQPAGKRQTAPAGLASAAGGVHSNATGVVKADGTPGSTGGPGVSASPRRSNGTTTGPGKS